MEKIPTEETGQKKDELTLLTLVAKNFSIDLERLPDYACQTPAEHLLRGSTFPSGMKFHPNVPLAFLAGGTLESINVVREKMNSEGEGGILFIFSTPKGKPVWVKCRLLPLTEDMLNSSESLPTFQVISSDDSKAAMLTPEGIQEGMVQKLNSEQTRLRTVGQDRETPENS